MRHFIAEFENVGREKRSWKSEFRGPQLIPFNDSVAFLDYWEDHLAVEVAKSGALMSRDVSVEAESLVVGAMTYMFGIYVGVFRRVGQVKLTYFGNGVPGTEVEAAKV